MAKETTEKCSWRTMYLLVDDRCLEEFMVFEYTEYLHLTIFPVSKSLKVIEISIPMIKHPNYFWKY